MNALPDHDIRDIGLAAQGVLRIEWADMQMPVLAAIRKRFESERPLEGVRCGCCLHVTTETANLMRTLKAGGADVALCASNPLSTQDDTAAALVEEYGISVYAIRGEDNDTYYSHIRSVVARKPHVTMDDGADVIGIIHGEMPELAQGIYGGTEETTTGVIRLKALEAVMDGFRVMPMIEAARQARIFVTATGDIHVIRGEHFQAMTDGAIVANTGHFNVEIDIPALEALATRQRTVRENVVEYTLADGRRIYLLAEGRLVNLAAAEGHPAAVMDMSFANQSLSAEFMVQHHTELEKRVYTVPQHLDDEIAKVKLATMKVDIDELTDEQRTYLASWDQGT